MGQIHLDSALPTLQNNKLCWIVSGGLSSNMPTHKSVLQASIKDPADHSDDTLAGRLVNNFLLNIALDLETSGLVSLGDSYCLARRRFKSLEAKLDRNPALKAQYSQLLREYIDLGRMSETQFFLPHHCVHKQKSTSTKLRVVFNVSAKTTFGSSLNDLLLAGPTVQQNILRFFKVAL